MRIRFGFSLQSWLLILGFASICHCASRLSGNASLLPDNSVEFHQELTINNTTSKFGSDVVGINASVRLLIKVQTNKSSERRNDPHSPHSTQLGHHQPSNVRDISRSRFGDNNVTQSNASEEEKTPIQPDLSSSANQQSAADASLKYESDRIFSEESSESSSGTTTEQRSPGDSAANRSKEAAESSEAHPTSQANCSNITADERVQLLVDFSTTVLENGMQIEIIYDRYMYVSFCLR